MTHRTTLTIQDQVNIKFDGLDPLVRRKINDACKFMNHKARHMPSFKMGRWDGRVPFATIGGASYLNMLDRILPIVIEHGYEIDIVDKRKPFTFEFPKVSEDMLAHKCWAEGHPMAGQPIKLRNYQVDAVERYLANLQSIQSISTGAGKAQPLWSKIKVPGGWTTMGEIKPGDVVSTPDGGIANVVSIHPQGEKQYYRITFKDGRTAEACGDHLWNVYCVDWSKKMINGIMTKEGNAWRTITTDQIRAQMAKNKRPLKIQLVEADNSEDVSFKIDPYVLGCLIGDGGLSHQTAIAFSTADYEIVEKINRRLDPEYAFKKKSGQNYDYVLTRTDEYRAFCAEQPKGQRDRLHRYRIELERLGLKGTKSDTKFIPREYMGGSHQQRISLIQGLMDTDGYVCKNGTLSFCTVSEQLANDVAELVRSVGGLARIKTKKTTYTHNGEKREGKLAYNVLIRYREPRSLVSLPRKVERAPEQYQYTDQLNLQIMKIEPVGRTECQCILIDHPDHLYITDNYVVTHNTLLTATLSAVMEPYGRTIVIVPSKSLVVQTEEDYRNLGLDVGVFYGERKEWGHQHTISTWQSLSIFDKNTKRGTLKVPKGKPSAKKAPKLKKNVEDFTPEELGITIQDFLKDMICVMVDEVHSAKADQLKGLLTDTMADIPVRWGLTGTVPKDEHEKMALLVSLGPVVGEVRADYLQELGVLAKCHVNILQMMDGDKEFRSFHDEYEWLNNDRERISFISEYCKAMAETGNTLILVDRIETGKYLRDLLGDDVVFISGEMKNENRAKEYKSVSKATNKIIIATYGVASTGINIPRIFNLILFEAGKSFVRVIQSIGRGLRTAEDKDYVNITDISSNLKFSKKHMAERKKFYKEANYPFEIIKVNYR